jgi:hypothetical protein
MVIKDKFTLLSGNENVLNLSQKQIADLSLEQNAPKYVYASLELKKSLINHHGFDKILKVVQNVKTTKDLDVIVWDQYSISASYNRKTKSKIVNLAPFNAKDISRVSYMNLYASVVYAHAFENFVTGRVKLPVNMAPQISLYWFGLFNQVFGKDYGLTGTYSSKLPALKFLLTLYIFVAFFGKTQNKQTFNLAKQYSGYDYTDIETILKKNDFTDIKNLIKALSESGIMPGFNLVKFTSKIVNFFGGITFLPAFEDLSRFMSLLVVSTISNQTIAKPFIAKYNKKVFTQLVKYVESKLF